MISTKSVILFGIVVIIMTSFSRSATLSPIVETLLPEKISYEEVVLKGSVVFFDSEDTMVRFSYGEDRENLDNFTKWKNKPSLPEFSDTVDTFLPNILYYYRAEAKSKDGFNYGRILSFINKKEEKEYFKEKVSGEAIEVSISIKEEGQEKTFSIEEETEFFINPISERKSHIEDIRESDNSCSVDIPDEIFENYRLRAAQISDIRGGDDLVIFFKRLNGDFLVDKIVIER